jgi:WD40 repeat protein
LSIDGKIKLWNLSNIKNPTCLKSIDVNFEPWDILIGNNNNVVVCGEEIMMYNLETDNKIIIVEKRYYKFVDFNLLARINDNIGVCTSLNDYYLVFDLNNGKILRKIEMDKTHFICQMENNQKIEKERMEEKKKELEKKKKEGGQFKDEEEEDNDDNSDLEKRKKKEKNEIQKFIRDLGSGKCKEYEGGHKGHVHALLGINTEQNKDTIISGAEDNLIKLININNPREIVSLSGHNNTIESLVLDNTKQYLYSGSLDYIIKKWDLDTKECICTMRFNNAFQNLLLYMDCKYLLSVGVNSKVKLWNEECLNFKTYLYTHGPIKSGLIVSYDKEYNKTYVVFGDNKGDIFIKGFIFGEENINKYNEFKNKLLKEEEEKMMKTRSNVSNRKPIVKLSFKTDDFDKNFNFKESTYETDVNEFLLS